MEREREQGAGLEKEVQSLLEKLACEVERNTRLSSELQEGSHGKEVVETFFFFFYRFSTIKKYNTHVCVAFSYNYV